MSEPFPTKADIDFFASREATPLRDLWEPKFGDRLCPKGAPPGFHQVYIHGTGLHHVAFLSERDMTADIECIAELDRHYIWLPRQGQLQEMLEERGCFIETLGPFVNKETSHEAKVYRGVGDPMIRRFGPTPSIALGRALLEVIQGGKK